MTAGPVMAGPAMDGPVPPAGPVAEAVAYAVGAITYALARLLPGDRREWTPASRPRTSWATPPMLSSTRTRTPLLPAPGR